MKAGSTPVRIACTTAAAVKSLLRSEWKNSSNHCLVYMTDPTVQNIEFEAALPTPIHYRSKNLEYFGRTVV